MRDGSWMKPVAWDAVRGSFTWGARRKVQRIPSPTSQSRCHPKSTYSAAFVLHASPPQETPTLPRRAIFRALAVRALCELSESVNFCFVSSVALAIRRASRSNSVRSKDRLPLARGALDPGRMTAEIETPSGSFSTKAARSASAAVGFVTLKNCDCTSRTITARSGKSTATKNVAQMGVGRDSSNSSAQGRK